MEQQLIFDANLSEHTRFDNFVCTEANATLLGLLKQFFVKNNAKDAQLVATQMKFFYLHGKQSVGKTHLMQALCSQAQEQGLSVIYLPMQEMTNLPAKAVLENLEETHLVCIDDVHLIANNEQWQVELFHFYNKIREKNNYLFVSANDVPESLGISLKDLVSRLQWGVSFRVHPLNETEIRQLILQRVAELGFQLNPDVVDYILLRAPRDLAQLLKIIDQLNAASWQNKKAITKPFAKEVLGW